MVNEKLIKGIELTLKVMYNKNTRGLGDSPSLSC